MAKRRRIGEGKLVASTNDVKRKAISIVKSHLPQIVERRRNER